MRVIFMGTPDFAVPTLEAIIAAGHEVALVVSQPDKAVGRSKALKYTPVKACAISHGIEVYQPERVRNEECVEYLRQYEPDIIIVEAFAPVDSKSDFRNAALRLRQCPCVLASEVSRCGSDPVGGDQWR